MHQENSKLVGQNSLYECSISHTRVSPKHHAFSYRVFMLSMNLDDFPRLALLSKNRFNLFSLRNEDHINTNPQQSIRQNLTTWLYQCGTEIPADAIIRLITFPRVLGYAFNPVSFYYISSKENRPLTAVAEVTNTYKEMKLYPLGEPDGNGHFNLIIPKDFYVSPFSDPNDTFHFRLQQPNETWTVHIDNISSGKPNLISSIRGQQLPLTSARLAWFAIKYPLISISIIFRIHLHALFLFLKKIPHFPKSTPISGSRMSQQAASAASSSANPNNQSAP